MPYPSIAAGQEITAALMTSMLEIEAVKTADQTITNSATLADAVDLALPLEGNASYRGELVLWYSADATQDLAYAWTVPAGLGGRRGLIGPDQTAGTATDLAAMQSRVSGSFTTSFRLGGAGAVHRIAREALQITTVSAGTLQLRFAQAAAAASTSATVLASSYIWLKRTA